MTYEIATLPPSTRRPIAQHTLSKPEKAAIIIGVLIKADATINLDHISTDSLKQAIVTMSSIGDVPQAVVDTVILEFLTELGLCGLSLSGDLNETLNALKGHVSDKVIEKIRKSYAHSPKLQDWARIATYEPQGLRKLLELEHPQVAAAVLSKIPSAVSAEVLGEMDQDMARNIMLAIINAHKLTAETLELIGKGISQTLFAEDSESVFDKPPDERAGDIMNYAEHDVRKRMMEDFTATEPDTAERIRKVMFTFADIPHRLSARDVSTIIRAVDSDVVLHALQGSQADVPETFAFLMDNLPARAAAQLIEDLGELGQVSKKEHDKAMNGIVATIRQMESDGAITLILDEEA